MQIIHGDCLEVLRSLPEHSVDSICSDPPAGINFMGMAFDSDRGGRDTWIAWLAGIMSEARRVIKPGGHAFIWALPRTSHWTALALENAGWEIREKHYHVFGSGFPKSHNISKAIDRMYGAEREVIGISPNSRFNNNAMYANGHGLRGHESYTGDPITLPATPLAKQYDGWGTATKPAAEEWILARAPLAEKSIAENVLRWGTGGINIDATRVNTHEKLVRPTIKRMDNQVYGKGLGSGTQIEPSGRFPSNFLLSHSLFCTEDQCIDQCPIAVLDRQSGIRKSGGGIKNKAGHSIGMLRGEDAYHFRHDGTPYEASEGGASRYFQTFYYCPKPSKRERNSGLDSLQSRAVPMNGAGLGEGKDPDAPSVEKNIHPTVKPASLMNYLCKMITPQGGTVLDPFMGSGTTGIACIQEGFDFIGIERESEYIEIARARIEHAIKLHAGK